MAPELLLCGPSITVVWPQCVLLCGSSELLLWDSENFIIVAHEPDALSFIIFLSNRKAKANKPGIGLSPFSELMSAKNCSICASADVPMFRLERVKSVHLVHFKEKVKSRHLCCLKSSKLLA